MRALAFAPDSREAALFSRAQAEEEERDTTDPVKSLTYFNEDDRGISDPRASASNPSVQQQSIGRTLAALFNAQDLIGKLDRHERMLTNQLQIQLASLEKLQRERMTVSSKIED